MTDINEMALAFVSVWNETDPQRRQLQIRELWLEDGIECTPSRETQGYANLEARIAASHEKNVRQSGYEFRLRGNAAQNHDVVKFQWDMLRRSDAAVIARGSYILLLNGIGKIRAAYFFADES
jgi:hypothetical protein